MKDERKKQLMEQFGMPNSQSLKNLIEQVEMETEVACNKRTNQVLARICAKIPATNLSAHRIIRNAVRPS